MGIKGNYGFKYDYPILTNTCFFVVKTSHLTYWAGDKVGNNINIVRVGLGPVDLKKFNIVSEPMVTSPCKPRACHQEVWDRKQAWTLNIELVSEFLKGTS